jgi:hypothetical protein
MPGGRLARSAVERGSAPPATTNRRVYDCALESREKQRAAAHSLGRREWAAQQGATGPLAAPPPAPVAWAAGERAERRGRPYVGAWELRDSTCSGGGRTASQGPGGGSSCGSTGRLGKAIFRGVSIFH